MNAGAVADSIDDYRAAKQLGRKLFGDGMNVFRDAGLWHFGRFLDGGPPITSEGNDAVSPWHRPQEVFGVGRTLRESMRFATGPERVFSIAGMQPGYSAGTGYRVVFDKYGRVRGYTSPAGVFSRNFPGTGRDGFFKDHCS
jgi:hypothetical protein